MRSWISVDSWLMLSVLLRRPDKFRLSPREYLMSASALEAEGEEPF
jgi:hypothetical protein